MSKIIKIIAAFAIVIFLGGCNPDEESTVPIRDRQTQYVSDNADIVEFLKTHSYTVNDNPGAHDDQDVTFTKVPVADPTSIWNSGDLLQRSVTRDEVDYIIYYLKFREGGGADVTDLHLQPSNVDAVLAAYEGRFLSRAKVADPETGVLVGDLLHKVFETTPYPSSFLPLEGTIEGWGEIFPQFRPGDRTSVVGQPNLYTDFGAGVMFVPSGLAYFNNITGSIPEYAPLIFAFKLYDISRLDQDGDGVPSYLEDRNNDRYIYTTAAGVAFPEDDTDGDGTSDYMDADDDNDGVLTKTELRRADPENPNGPYTYYSFDGAVDDDANTPYNETYGIPRCYTTPPTYDPVTGVITYNPADFTDPTRLRRHLDPACELPYGDEFDVE